MPNLDFSTTVAISLSLSDSATPVFFTILRNTELCFCSRLNGVSNSITLPEDNTYNKVTMVIVKHLPTNSEPNTPILYQSPLLFPVDEQ